MTPKTFWISLYGTLLLSFVICSHKKLRRDRPPVRISDWFTPGFTEEIEEESSTTQKTTPTWMFVHRRRSYWTSVGFEKISTTDTFVDKTMMLERFFETYPYHIVTYPYKFGKTINIDMIYRFVGIELNETRRPLEKEFTSSYSLFANQTEIGKKRKDIIQNHLAEYPVLYLNLIGFYIGLGHSNERMNSMGDILKRCIVEYEPLLDSELVQNNQTHAENFDFIRKAIDKELTYVDIMNSLYEFSRILHNHFNKKVVLLIDDFDFPFNSAVNKGFGYELVDLLVIMLDRMFHPSDDQCHVGYALITGFSHTMATLISTKVPEIRHLEAFENHVFAPFYGITDEELAVLLMGHSNLTDADRINIPRCYQGYLIRDTNRSIYNTFSIIEQIKKDCMGCNNSWYNNQSFCFTFVEFLNNKQIYEYMLRLIFSNVIEIRLLPCIGLEDLNDLWRIERAQKSPCDFDPRVLFSFFFEYGYLSYTGRDNWYRVPNTEISEGFKQSMMKFYDSILCQGESRQKWYEKYALREIFKAKSVTNEMLIHFQNALKNLIRTSESFYTTRHANLFHYQALIDYNARKDLANGTIRSVVYNESVEQPVHIVMISFQSIMALCIGLTENGPAESTLEYLYRYSITYETDLPAKMIKYIGISFNQNKNADALKMAYDCRGHIDAENYQALLATATPSTAAKRIGRNSRYKIKKSLEKNERDVSV
ncbi:uncharacterized protein LOC135847806 [Planococcus citri]|uniref:uncharacterized protein LOC135847806 n=1 Tax=Planococcus citri TaxID=170843 RepID=UPI0031F8E241